MRLSKIVALSGLITAVSLVLMLLTGVLPFAALSLPAIAGAFLIIPVIEIDRKRAIYIYIAVSLLSVFITPDRDAAVYYIALFGYYPIIKSKFEQLESRKLEYILKFGLFTVVFAVVAVLSMFITGLEALEYEPIWILGLFFLLLFAFFLYDFALSRIISTYIKRIRSVLFTIFK